MVCLRKVDATEANLSVVSVRLTYCCPLGMAR